MKKWLVFFLILAIGLLTVGCGKKPQQAIEEDPVGDENWTLGFSIVPDMDDLNNATVRLVDDLSVYVPLHITKDGKVSGGFENQVWETNKVTINGEGTYHKQKLVFTGTWEAETQFEPPHAGCTQSGTFTIEGEYVDNTTFVLNEEKSSATITTSNWYMDFGYGFSKGVDIYEKAPLIKIHAFRPELEEWSPYK